MLARIRRRQDYLPPERTEHVQQNVASGTAWSGIALAATTLIQLVRSIIFARLLMPADFGVLSLANVLTQFVLIFANFGFNASVVYQKDLDRKDLNTCWWSNLTIDGTVAVICCAVAYLGRHQGPDPRMPYGGPAGHAVRDQYAVGSIHLALMRRQFMFKEISLIAIAGAVSTPVSALVFVAVFSLGVYGLVLGMVVGSLVMTVLNFHVLRWLPSFTFSRDRLRQHLGYGGWFLGVQVVTYVNGNLDRTLVGTQLDTEQLGYYEYASNIPLTVATQLSNAINSVLFPAFSSLQDDLARLGDLLRKVYRYNALLVYPLLAGMALVADDFVTTMYGAKWAPVIPVLRVFCLVGMARIVINPLYPLCNGLGLPRLPFKWSLVLVPINLAALWFGIKYHGLIGAVEARMIVPVIITATLGREIFRQARFRARWLAQALLPACVCCLAMAAGVLGIRLIPAVHALPVLPRLVVQIAVGGSAYVGMVVLAYRQDARNLWSQGRRFLERG
ncbi:MAG: oligosaccharide flippase family protein [Candidatus Krumholzibacteriia bacterium]